jgi:hypothetical protein
MRTPRQTALRRALLQALAPMPEHLPLPGRVLRADAARLVHPPATTAELDAEIRAADQARLLVSLPGEDDWQHTLTDAGRLWLARNP